MTGSPPATFPSASTTHGELNRKSKKKPKKKLKPQKYTAEGDNNNSPLVSATVTADGASLPDPVKKGQADCRLAEDKKDEILTGRLFHDDRVKEISGSTLIERERERSSSDNQVIKAAACLPELSEDKREMASAQPHVVTAAVTASAMRNGPSPSSSETNVRKYEDRRLSNDRYLKPLEDQTTGEDDKVWNIVASKKKRPSSPNITSPFKSDLQATSLPLPVATKGQKKNAKKSEAKKAQRHADEIDRLQRLAKHKKDLESERINELYSGREKRLGGKATVTSNGKLVWD
ncbi:hypothetical protein CNBG_1339 [Cryptococcus deuterogattii R265]|uniref:uncharacterized protein n=1 Tax=Cryptococcus deuterogattii (strain R265) TaxID=294750 RepID=UPI00193681A1|nr:hypothetical protein CNBG_1339 [Cryptococcus deuterogattii R265]